MSKSRFYQQACSLPGYLKDLPGVDVALLQQHRQNKAALLEDSSLEPLQRLRAELDDVQATHRDLTKAVVELGRSEDIAPQTHAAFQGYLKELMPWKKGPFNLCGTEIDAEWRSDVKWQRIKEHVDIKGKRVADIGCNNGYFMLRMAAENPEWVIGFEPQARHWYTFDLLNHLAKQPQLYFELLGVEEIDLFPKSFDVIFCLGILYHHTDPVGLLRKMRAALSRGGTLVIDCQGIAGEESLALVPQGRYAGAAGIWFLPTELCLRHWLLRAGFKTVQVFFNEALETEEQRRTPWAPIKSLQDFLDPEDPTRTIEGYPAPRRFYLLAR